jgi:hypothetical protein
MMPWPAASELRAEVQGIAAGKEKQTKEAMLQLVYASFD